MRKQVLVVLAMGTLSLAHAQSNTPSKVGVIRIQNAIVGTKEGQKAAQDLETRFVAPKRKEMEQKQAEVTALQQKLDKGKNTMSEDARQQIVRDIDQKTKAFNRANEDAQAELEQEQGKLLNELGGKMMAVIGKYAKDNGYSIILDVSGQNSPVVWISDAIDITDEIVALYDKNTPSASPAAPKPGGAAAPPPSRPNPSATPAAPKPGPSTPAPKPPASAPAKKP